MGRIIDAARRFRAKQIMDAFGLPVARKPKSVDHYLEALEAIRLDIERLDELNADTRRMIDEYEETQRRR